MRRGHAVLQSRDVQQAGLEIDLVPAHRDELADAQPMPVGEEDERAIARTVAADLAGGLQQLLDLLRRQIFAPAARSIGLARRGDAEGQGPLQIAALRASYCVGARELSHFRALAALSPRPTAW